MKTSSRQIRIRRAVSIFAVLMLSFLFSEWLIAADKGVVRHYYIAAENVDWNYAPNGDVMHDLEIPMPWANRAIYKKTRYIGYTDATFTTRSPEPKWLGILGPTIHAQVGDTVEVTFWNRTREAHSIHPHGLRYSKENEGAHYGSHVNSGIVAAGQRYTYSWTADESSGPDPNDASSVVWPYHGHANLALEINEGLIGAIVVTARGKAKPDGTPIDVDREFVLLYSIFDELQGKEEGLFHSLNGYIFSNLTGLEMNKGDRVRWYLIGMGSERDIHTAHWHGNTVKVHSSTRDVVPLFPAYSEVADMKADNPGTWMVECHVADHFEGGMMTSYVVGGAEAPACPITYRDITLDKDVLKFAVVNNSDQTVTRVMNDVYSYSDQNIVRYLRFSAPAVHNIPPHGSEVIVAKLPWGQNTKGMLGYVLQATFIRYADGKIWRPTDFAYCFSIHWLQPQHPNVITLPPIQTN
jgi:manganese oxidase